MNKRGLSDIVTAVLIILLVLIAIVIIWLSLRPTVDTTGKETEKTVQCLGLNIQPVSCTYSFCGGLNGQINSYFMKVGVRRNPDSSAGPSDINFVFTDNSGKEAVVNTDDALNNYSFPNTFEVSNFVLSGASLASTPNKVELVPTVGSEKNICPGRTPPRSCVEADTQGFSNLDYCADITGNSTGTNPNGLFDLNDVISFINYYSNYQNDPSNYNPVADANGDGVIDYEDVSIFCFAFTNQEGCSP